MRANVGTELGPVPDSCTLGSGEWEGTVRSALPLGLFCPDQPRAVVSGRQRAADDAAEVLFRGASAGRHQ